MTQLTVLSPPSSPTKPQPTTSPISSPSVSFTISPASSLNSLLDDDNNNSNNNAHSPTLSPSTNSSSSISHTITPPHHRRLRRSRNYNNNNSRTPSPTPSLRSNLSPPTDKLISSIYSSISNVFQPVDVAPPTTRKRLAAVLQSHPSNRNCADCRINLGMGLSEIYISFYYTEKTTSLLRPAILRPSSPPSIPSFSTRHSLLAPSSHLLKKKTSAPPFTLSHAVFICESCSLAHSSLGSRLSRVKCIQCRDEIWTDDELSHLERHANNRRMNDVLEKHMPEYWKRELIPRLSSGNTTTEEREVFVRAKYEALAFLYPHGPLERRWGLKNCEDEPNVSHREVEPRLVDYFCVVGPDWDDSPLPIEENATLKLIVTDCYPPTPHPDTPLPHHLPQFISPDPPRVTPHQKPPTAISFVLTDETGRRLYAHSLTFHQPHPLHPDLYAPHTLLLLSHHPFFSLFHNVLGQIYRISLSTGPLPLERYISNFCAEVPLPPRGTVAIKFGFIDCLTFHRPARNELPLMDVSFRGLFGMLSPGSVILVVGLLLSESRVCLCSSRYSLLCPVGEALRGLLFPWTWQGAYVPVLPYGMLDVLDAPMPFLIGLHGRYLKEVPASERPLGVVFVDLDEDVVHLGMEEGGFARRCPALPEKDVVKLKKSLDEWGGGAYMPNWNPMGRVTYGPNAIVMPNQRREAYCRQVSLETGGRRRSVLKTVDDAFRNNEYLMPVDGFVMEVGVLVKGGEGKRGRMGSEKESGNLFDPRGDETKSFSAKAIRQAFLRFFVSIFKNYAKFLTAAPSHFDHQAFVNDATHFSNAERDWLYSTTQTQMFERFIYEKVESPSQPEVLFFDESIIAKKQRSKMAVLRQNTPFLSDKSEEITDTYTPPPPSNGGLPDDGRTYSYATFPKLDTSLYGKIRPPKTWKQDNLSRNTTDSVFMRKHQKQILDVILNEGTGGKHAKERNVEWAIHAMAYRHAGAGGEGSDYGSPSPPPASVSADILCQAQGLISKARRKQMRVLNSVVKIQALYRMYIERKGFIHFLRSTNVIQSQMRLYRFRKRHGELSGMFNMNVVKMQRMARGSRDRKVAERRRSAIVKVQKVIRGRLERTMMKRGMVATVRLQARVRGRRVRFVWMMLRGLVIKVQAMVRGRRTRRLEAVKKKEMFEKYRRQLVILWNVALVPLLYRSRFWSNVCRFSDDSDGFQMTFMRLNILLDELKRVWLTLGMSLDGRNAEDTYLEVKQMIDLSSSLSSSSLASRFSSSPDRSASDRVAYERTLIYDAFKSMPDLARNRYFSKLEIREKEKKKKVHATSVIWMSFRLADASSEFILQQVESREKAQSSSQRSKAPKISDDSITAKLLSMSVQSMIDERTRRNVRLAVSALMLAVERKKRTDDDIRYVTLLGKSPEDGNDNNWKKRRRQVIKSVYE